MKYRSTTREIEVVVEPIYLEEETDSANSRYFWAYSVGITNHSEEAVQLRTRYWHITDANGVVEEVRGPGVVGEEPVLKPGESFEYTSGCPLTTTSGIMVGEYAMETATGESFQVGIPAFSLDIPDSPKTLN